MFSPAYAAFNLVVELAKKIANVWSPAAGKATTKGASVRHFVDSQTADFRG